MKKVLILVLFIALVLTVLWANFNTPMMGEDFALSINYRQKVGLSISEKAPIVFQYIVYHAKTWNTRIGEANAIMFLSIDKAIFNVINSGFFVLLSLLTTLFALQPQDRKDIWKVLFFTSISMIIYLVFLPGLGETVFWLTGSTNYLWALVFQISFLFLYDEWPEQNTLAMKILQVVIMSVLGILAGLSNENTGIVIILVCITTAFFQKRPTIRKASLENNIGLSFFILGYCYLLFAPSTFIRRSYYNQVYGIGKLGLPLLLRRLMAIMAQFISQYKAHLIIVSVLIILLLILNKTKSKSTIMDLSINNRLYLLVVFSFLSIFDMIVVPYYEIRSAMLVGFSLTALIVAIQAHLIQTNTSVARLICFALLFSFVVFLINTLPLYNRFYKEAEVRDKSLIIASQSQNKDVIISRFKTPENQRTLNTRESYLVNSIDAYKRYYGLDSISFK